MPCPPSLEEQRMMRADHEEPRARRFSKELKRLQALLRAFVRWLDARKVQPTKKQQRELEEVLREPPELRFGAPPEGWYHDPAKGRLAIEWADTVSADRQRLELALCRGRTLLVQLGDLDGVPTAHARRFEEEVALHAEHREEDRQQVLRNLKARRKKAKSAEQRASLDAQIRKVQGLPIETLLRDRHCF